MSDAATDAPFKWTKQIFQLTELEARYGVALEELLRLAAGDRLQLCVRVHPNLVVWRAYLPAIHHPEGRSEGIVRYSIVYSPVKDAPTEITDPVDAVFLSASDCVEILKQDVCSQDIFRYAVQFTGCIKPRDVFPLDLDAYLPRYWPTPCYRALILYPKNFRPEFEDRHGFSRPIKVRIERKDLCITRSQLARFLSGFRNFTPSEDPPVEEMLDRYQISTIDGFPANSISLAGCDCDRLMFMRQAALRFCTVGSDRFLGPDEPNDQIEAFLRATGAFSAASELALQKQIGAAAELIRPRAWMPVRTGNDDGSYRGYISPHLNATSIAWVVAWKDKSYIQEGTYYSTDSVAEWIKDFLEKSSGAVVSMQAAKMAALIIRPSEDERLPGRGRQSKRSVPSITMDEKWKALVASCAPPKGS